MSDNKHTKEDLDYLKSLSLERKINVTVTRLQKDIGDIYYTLIDCSYGFLPSTEEQKKEWIEALTKFAKNIGCGRIVAYTNNPMAINAMEKVGMKEAFKVYLKEVE